MEIVVRGKHVEVPRALYRRSHDKLGRLARVARDIQRVDVEFSQVRTPRGAGNQVCAVAVHLKRGVVRAHASAPEATASLDLVVDKLDQQIARLKQRRVDRQHATRSPERAPRAVPAEPPPSPPRSEPDGSRRGNGRANGRGNGRGADGEVERIRSEAKPMTVEEARLQLDVLGYDFLLFTLAGSGRAAVLFRRRDGHLALVETPG